MFRSVGLSDNVNDTIDKMLSKVPLKNLEKGNIAKQDVKDMLMLGAKPDVKIELPSLEEGQKEIERLLKQKLANPSNNE